MPDDISLIPKEYKEGFNLGAFVSKIGFYIAGLIALSLLVYGGLFFYGNSLKAQLREAQNQIEGLNKQRDMDFEKKVVSLEKSLNSLKAILNNHSYWSNVFSELGKLTIPQVSFSDFSGTMGKDGSIDVSLSGSAGGYTYLAKQMVSFGQEKLVHSIEVSGITLNTAGGIDFSLKVNFLKDIVVKQ